MNDGSDSSAARHIARPLSDAIRDVKNAAADRTDVVVDLRGAERMRLELLAAELEPVFADAPRDADLFDFAISSGLQPRLWIDAVSHVSMGRDKRTYRFVRDTRLGRVVLAESATMKPVADQVTRYIAERLVERQRMLDGAPETFAPPASREAPEPVLPLYDAGAGRNNWPAFLAGLYMVCSGALLAVLAGLIFLLGNKLGQLLGWTLGP